MTTVRNHTPFASLLEPHVNHQGKQCQLLIVKGVWSLLTQQLADKPGVHSLRQKPYMVQIGELSLAPIQRQVLGARLDDEIEWLPCDNYPRKGLFDFMVCGYAWTSEPCEQFSAAVLYREQRIGIDLHAPRYWKPTVMAGGGGVPGSYLGHVRTVPVHPAFAYGGLPEDDQTPDNPEGMGSGHKNLSHIAMPWVDHPSHRANTQAISAKPAAFGPWSAGAIYRQKHCGTYDDAWQMNRNPLPPLDMDMRYYNQAEPRLQWQESPRPGEIIELQNLSSAGTRHIVWPHLFLQADSGRGRTQRLQADTCIVTPESDSYALVWHCEVPTGASPTLSVS